MPVLASVNGGTHVDAYSVAPPTESCRCAGAPLLLTPGATVLQAQQTPPALSGGASATSIVESKVLDILKAACNVLTEAKTMSFSTVRAEGYLSLLKTISGSIDDEVRRESATLRSGHIGGSADGPANPCPGTDAFGVCCNSRRRQQEFGADGFRRRRRC